MSILSLAIRNVLRNRRRTVISVTAISLAGAAMIIWGTISGGYHVQMRNAATVYEIGEFQVHRQGYLESADFYRTIDPAADWLRSWEEAGTYASPRLYGHAMLLGQERSVGVQVRGIDPQLEREVTSIHEYLRQGEWLSNSGSVVIGGKLASNLNLRVGDRLDLVGQGADGSIASDRFTVGGVLRPINRKMDGRVVLMTMENFRQLFLLQDRVHEIAFRRHGDQLSLTEFQQSLLPSMGPDHSMVSWRNLKPTTAQTVDLLGIGLYFTMTVTYIALGALILNVFYMSVAERLKEFGVMKALGMDPERIIKMVLLEGLCLAVVSSLVMFVIAVPVSLWLEATGIDLSGTIKQISLAGIHLEPIIWPRFDLSRLWIPGAFMFVTIPLASLLPALKAGAIEPISAIEEIRA